MNKLFNKKNKIIRKIINAMNCSIKMAFIIVVFIMSRYFVNKGCELSLFDYIMTMIISYIGVVVILTYMLYYLKKFFEEK